MKVTFQKSHANGTIEAPPSKSIAHRLLIAAGLAEGESVIHHVARSEDVLATIDCLQALGADCRLEKDSVKVSGIGGKIKTAQPLLSCRECGSTLRFFVPIALLSPTQTTLCGSERLFQRPLSVYEEICREQSLLFCQNHNTLTVQGKLAPAHYTFAGNISSQFVSGLLFALPLLERESKITLTDPIESRSYINLTVKALADFGITVTWQDDNTLLVPGQQSYSASEITVEGDYSNAAFFSALATLGENVTVTGLSDTSLQGDRVYIDYFEQLKNGTPTLSLANCPDLGPILFAMAGMQNGAHFTDTARLRIKESDRAACMAEELNKFGIRSEIHENDVIIRPTSPVAPNTTLFGHNDHRIVMALSVMLSLVGGTIDGAEAVAKSMPDFFERLASLGVQMQITK